MLAKHYLDASIYGLPLSTIQLHTLQVGDSLEVEHKQAFVDLFPREFHSVGTTGLHLPLS